MLTVRAGDVLYAAVFDFHQAADGLEESGRGHKQ